MCPLTVNNALKFSPGWPVTISHSQHPRVENYRLGAAFVQATPPNHSRATRSSTGCFSHETFSHALGSGQAPVGHVHGPVPDASSNPIFNRVNTCHLGILF